MPGLNEVENGFVISDIPNDTEDSGNQFVWIPVAENDDYKRINFGALEPSWINNKDGWETFFRSLKDDEDYLPEGITNEKETVLKAGGFYVGRYEAGQEKENEKPVSKRGAKVWNEISQIDAKEKAKTFIQNTDVKSALISGIQWDKVMQFVNGKLDGKGNNYDVTIYSSTRCTKGEMASGQNEADKVCNIYDLEGNYYEYVAEKNERNQDYPYIGRGGNLGQEIFGPAAYRDNLSGLSYSLYTYRCVLYV